MDPHDDSTQSTEKKKVRGPTRMKNVISRSLHADKLPIDIDPHHWENYRGSCFSVYEYHGSICAHQDFNFIAKLGPWR